jgi:ketosteroid isomerase-like protein
MAQKNLIETVQELYAAFGRGDIPALIAGLDADITWVNPGPPGSPYFGTHKGHAGIGKLFGFLGEHMDIQLVQPTAFMTDGRQVVVLLRMEMVARPTGQRVAQECAHVWTFKDGRPIHFHDFQNNSAVAAALGLP